MPLPPRPPIHGTTSTTARDRTTPMDTLHAWGGRIPRPRGRRMRWVGSRVLALGLVMCVASGPVISPSAAAQQAAAAPAAHSAARQVPTATPTPVATATGQAGDVVPVQGDIIGDRGQPTPVMIVPIELGTPITISPNLTPSTVQLQVTPSPQTIAVAGCVSPDYIYQGCDLGLEATTLAGANTAGAMEHLRRLEARAIASVMQKYQLPESERPRVLRSARNEVRADLFAQLQEILEKAPTARLPDEWLLARTFTRLVREKKIEAATAAQAEYNRWRSNPCTYEPPPGFTYSAQSACLGQSSLFTPESPGLRAFAAYGAAAAFKTVQDDPAAAPVFTATSKASLVGYGYGTALVGGAAGAVAGYYIPAKALTGIFPFITRAVDAGAVAGATGAISIGSLVLIIIGAVTTGLLAGRSVIDEAALPGQLQEWLDFARSYDVGTRIRSYEVGQAFDFTGADVRKSADQELYAVFILHTLPDYPGTEPAPAAQPGAPRLVVAGSPVEWLQYTADDGSQRAARLSGRWFADRAASAAAGTARLTLSISYRDAAGAAWTAGRVGNQFLIVRVGDPTAADYPAPRQSADLTVVDASNRPVTARVGG